VNPISPPLPIPPKARLASSSKALKRAKMPRLGWLEIVVLGQTMLPAMMFIPPLIPLRFLTRAAAYVLPMVAFVLYLVSGRKLVGNRRYPPVPFLAFCIGWLLVSVINPGVNTFSSAFCCVGIATGVMSPAFWAPSSIRDSRQLGRLMILLLACNGASAVMGIAQVYRPETFRPPKLALEGREGYEEAMSVTMDNGRKFLRPAGLTDSPGGAAMGGQASVALGLAVALLPIAWWKRGIGVSLALAGILVLFYSQVRVMIITLAIGLIFWGILLSLRGEAKRLSMLLSCVFILGAVAVASVLSSGGSKVMQRFLTLFEGNAVSVYYKNRGAFVENGLALYLPKYPLGAGPGRNGMAASMFASTVVPPDRAMIWAETQVEAWVLDGGLPLLVAYSMALAAAIASATWTALKCPDREVAYWAGVVLVYGVGAVAMVMGYAVFMSPLGVQFWALMGALFGAQERARFEAAARLKAGLKPS
jgi:hypothetical protein